MKPVLKDRGERVEPSGRKNMGVPKKNSKIHKEVLVIGFVLLLMLLTLWGWYLKTNHIEVFEAGGLQDKREPQTNLTQVKNNEEAFTNSPAESQPEQTKNTVPQQSGLPVQNGNSLSEPAVKININTARIEELVTLNGIGEVKARDIVAYREQNGAFENIEQIQDVKGIGEATFNKIKDWITITDEKN
jgi:competence protein ComEA